MKHTRFAAESAAQAQAEALDSTRPCCICGCLHDAGNERCEKCRDPRAEAREKRTRQPVDRKTVLLKAAYDILKKVKDAPYVESAMEMTAFYDEAECDGLCLMEDIATELDIDTGR